MSIKSLNIKWVGLVSVVQMKNIYMSDDQDRVFLEVPNSLIHIDTFDSLQNQMYQLIKLS